VSRRCPTCGSEVREVLSDPERQRLAALSREYPGLRFDGIRDADGSISASYHGKPLIGNRSSRQVGEMLRAMTS
jgi:hypothetical protein